MDDECNVSAVSVCSPEFFFSLFRAVLLRRKKQVEKKGKSQKETRPIQEVGTEEKKKVIKRRIR